MFGRLPAHGLYCRHVTGLRLRAIDLRGAAGEARPSLVCDDVNDLDLDGVRSSPIAGSQPVVKLVGTRSAWLRGCASPAAEVFLAVHGAGSKGILLSGSDLT